MSNSHCFCCPCSPTTPGHTEDCVKATREIARLLEALRCLLPGLVLDLRYADDDDDKDALRSRIETVETAIKKATA